jgi:glucose-6-phosphate dehydrogenase assembly protein OpcA
MNIDTPQKRIIEAVRERFPEIAMRMDQWLTNSWEATANLPYAMLLEEFSQATTDAIANGDEATARKYLGFVAARLQSASVEEQQFIDVYFVESLLRSIKDQETKRWGWQLIPDRLQKLYLDCWGTPTFLK